MTVFFYVCEYFGITPREFFNTEFSNPKTENELSDAAKGLSNEQLEHLIAIAKGLKNTTDRCVVWLIKYAAVSCIMDVKVLLSVK